MPIKGYNDTSKDKSISSIIAVLKGVLISYIISIILLLIYAIILYLTKISESSMSTAIMIITMISIAVASIYTSIKVESMGWLTGAAVGFIYMIILFFLSLIFKTQVGFDRSVLFQIFMGFIIGSLSGIIGINLKS